jgi:hypothetical protein
MYCPTCGNEITVELKYCNRCGANLALPTTTTTTAIAPVKLTVPSIVLGLTIVIGLGIIFGGASEFARQGLHPAAIVWMVLVSAAMLFGCTGLMIRFWTKLLTMQREIVTGQPQRPAFAERATMHNLPPPRMEPVPSVTENTTRTFTPIYRDPADRGTR